MAGASDFRNEMSAGVATASAFGGELSGICCAASTLVEGFGHL